MFPSTHRSVWCFTVSVVASRAVCVRAVCCTVPDDAGAKSHQCDRLASLYFVDGQRPPAVNVSPRYCSLFLYFYFWWDMSPLATASMFPSFRSIICGCLLCSCPCYPNVQTIRLVTTLHHSWCDRYIPTRNLILHDFLQSWSENTREAQVGGWIIPRVCLPWARTYFICSNSPVWYALVLALADFACEWCLARDCQSILAQTTYSSEPWFFDDCPEERIAKTIDTCPRARYFLFRKCWDHVLANSLCLSRCVFSFSSRVT